MSFMDSGGLFVGLGFVFGSVGVVWSELILFLGWVWSFYNSMGGKVVVFSFCVVFSDGVVVIFCWVFIVGFGWGWEDMGYSLFCLWGDVIEVDVVGFVVFVFVGFGMLCLFVGVYFSVGWL